VYLNNHTYFSLRYGTLSIKKLIQLAKDNNIPALALTDINNSSGMLDFVKLCKEEGIKPIAGMEFRNQNTHVGTCIAKNNEGFKELNDYVTDHNLTKKSYPLHLIEFKNAFTIYPFGSKRLVDLKNHEFVGIRPFEVLKLFTSDYLNDPSKLVIRQPITFADKQGYHLHKNLRAVDNNILLSQLTAEMLANESETMRPIPELLRYYEDYPFIIENTQKLINQCEIDFDFRSLKNRKTFTGNLDDDKKLLKKL